MRSSTAEAENIRIVVKSKCEQGADDSGLTEQGWLVFCKAQVEFFRVIEAWTQLA